MRTLLVSLAVPALAGGAFAQGYDNVWAKFEESPSSIDAPTISSPTIETDVAWADLDQNGWVDVVIVRKEPFTSVGKRANMLLMNYDGVLTNETATFATASDVPGDNGFGTATNDRDVVIVDVDNDGWEDVVTATTISDGDPKHIGHPRIYMNLGEDGGGNWLGLEYQDARFPQLLHYGTGAALNPRFCSVAAGDVTGDGYADLYFGDYDSSGAGGSQQPSSSDMNDRLLINDGTGFFTDESQSRMTSQMLLSAFGMASVIDDMNGDGTLDIIKDTALNAPQYVAISYNNLLGLGSEGDFNNFDNDGVGSGAPYHVDTGDLNADGRPDIITSDDGQDRYRVNLGNDALGRAEFSGGNGGNAFTYVQGGDTGFASNNLIVDIDGDGWGDAITADIDVDIPSSNRMHIYHNTGTQQALSPGDVPVMREEFGSVGSNWIGVKGLQNDDLEKVHDFAAADFNNDGLIDLFISREADAQMWLQTPVTAQADLGLGGPGDLALSAIGDDLTTPNSVTRYQVQGVVPGGQVFGVFGLVNGSVPFKGGTLVPFPFLLTIPLVADADGVAHVTLRGAAGTPATVYSQAVSNDGGNWELSNALEIVVGI